MLTGALASSYYGRPRTTLDVDVVVAATRNDLARLAKGLANVNLKVEKRRLEAAWKSKYRIATIQDSKSPHSLDIIFTEGKLDRKAGSIIGLPTFYQTPESLILAKLRMIKATFQQEKAATDREDVRAILKFTRVGLKGLREKARDQGTSDVLERLMHE